MDAPPSLLLRLGVVQLDGIPRAVTRYQNLWTPAEPLVDPVTADLADPDLEDVSAKALFSSTRPEVYGLRRLRPMSLNADWLPS